MYNFALQKDMDEMLEEFEHLCSDVKDIELDYEKEKIEKYDCISKLGIVIYYMHGKAVAYIDDEETLFLLKGVDDSKNIKILEEITHELDQKVYLEFDTNPSCFAKDINRHMYRKHDYIKEEGLTIEEQEKLDLKEWKREEARQAYAMNQGVM